MQNAVSILDCCKTLIEKTPSHPGSHRDIHNETRILRSSGFISLLVPQERAFFFFFFLAAPLSNFTAEWKHWRQTFTPDSFIPLHFFRNSVQSVVQDHCACLSTGMLFYVVTFNIFFSLFFSLYLTVLCVRLFSALIATGLLCTREQIDPPD